jgi:hypothetical protein
VLKITIAATTSEISANTRIASVICWVTWDPALA